LLIRSSQEAEGGQGEARRNNEIEEIAALFKVKEESVGA
jgi:hypothetical protein